MTEFDDNEEVELGAPPWIATFADLMSLLVCFFVMLLTFSELDVIKYKQIAGSMKMAFGVQRKIEAESIPRGTSVIAKEFSPGTPAPSPRPVINQQTTNDSQPSLQVGSPQNPNAENADLESMPQELLQEKLKELLSHSSEEETLRELLKEGIADGKVDIESAMNQITIRIRENGSFPSGKAILNPDFLPLVAQLRAALREIKGMISVEGHTDNVPISSPTFDSNWDLSAARALSVAKELMKGDQLAAERFMVVGYADTKPFLANDSAEHRAANRRVEIVIRKQLGTPDEAGLDEL